MFLYYAIVLLKSSSIRSINKIQSGLWIFLDFDSYCIEFFVIYFSFNKALFSTIFVSREKEMKAKVIGKFLLRGLAKKWSGRERK